MDRLEEHRRRFAQQVAASAGVSPANQKLIDAFGTVPREKFLGPGPWEVFTGSGFTERPSDPALLYQDVLVALKSEARINNGQPSLHIACLAALDVKEGETVVHVGAGTGYYSAILAVLTAPTGQVIGYEIDEDLAGRAKDNLSAYRNVEVRHQSATVGPLPPCDVVYVNAGASAPLRSWTDALRPGGRLLFPLQPAQGGGYMLLITRPGDDARLRRGYGRQAFAVEVVSNAVFIQCTGAPDDDEAGERLSKAFAKGGIETVRSLHFDTPPDATCWFAGKDWWLSTRP